jgi:cation:H+ antiporter
MSFVVNILIIILSSVVLIKAVSLFIDSSTKIAHTLNISGYTVSFLLVAIATSLPETVVGVTSAVQGKSILSYGNALGSNIALLTVVVAIPGLMNSGIKTRAIFQSNDIYYTAFFSLLALLLSLDGVLSRTDGLALLIGYSIYSVSVLRRGSPIERLIHTFERTNIWKQAFLFIGSLALLLLASEGIVRGALNISLELKLALGFVGLTLTALGTSLPEIAYAIGAVKKSQESEVLGDVVGSVVANSTLVLGITSLVAPIVMSNSNLGISSNIFMVLAVLLFLTFSKTKGRLDRRESFILIMVYILFVGVEYYLQM